MTVASLVPAATDILLNMQAGDHLVAVSHWDPPLPQIASLPRAGDYRTIDWEKIAQLKPSAMIVQFAPGKMPTGLEEKAREMGVTLINVKINRLADIFTTIQQLGEAIHEPAKATAAIDKLDAELEAVRRRVSQFPPVSTLLIRSEDDLASVGGDNFMDDLLTLAGGKNVLSGGINSFPTIDREQLLSLQPEVVILLLPGQSTQVIEKAKRYWAGMPDVRAAKNHRLYILTEPYLLLPGMSAGKIARSLSERLHPAAEEVKP